MDEYNRDFQNPMMANYKAFLDELERTPMDEENKKRLRELGWQRVQQAYQALQQQPRVNDTDPGASAQQRALHSQLMQSRGYNPVTRMFTPPQPNSTLGIRDSLPYPVKRRM